jgi:hypothetical protein
LFRLDGGYIVVDGAAASRGADSFRAVAAQWSGYHVLAITGVPEGATEWTLAEFGRAAQAFDRVVVCESSHAASAGCTGTAARFARAVRAAGRTECHVVADAHRALRHCIEGMIPGQVIAYCCEDVDTAARILAEYGALPVSDVARTAADAAAGIHVALNGTTGELTVVHA